MTFTLHTRLEQDCHLITDLTLSRVLLMNDRRFLWCILVPRLENLRDLHDLPNEHRATLFDEIESVSKALIEVGNAHKINVAALGNQVPQLHVHVIARHPDDDAWPAPVWNAGPGQPYPDTVAGNEIAAIRALLDG